VNLLICSPCPVTPRRFPGGALTTDLSRRPDLLQSYSLSSEPSRWRSLHRALPAAPSCFTWFMWTCLFADNCTTLGLQLCRLQGLNLTSSSCYSRSVLCLWNGGLLPRQVIEDYKTWTELAQFYLSEANVLGLFIVQCVNKLDGSCLWSKCTRSLDNALC
jgi:hypothetical protein